MERGCVDGEGRHTVTRPHVHTYTHVKDAGRMKREERIREETIREEGYERKDTRGRDTGGRAYR